MTGFHARRSVARRGLYNGVRPDISGSAGIRRMLSGKMERRRQIASQSIGTGTES